MEEKDLTLNNRAINLFGDCSQNIGFPRAGNYQLDYSCYFSPVSLLTFALVGSSLSFKKLNAFVYTEADSAKGSRNVLRCVLDHLHKMRSPTPLPNNQSLTNEVELPDVSTV